MRERNQPGTDRASTADDQESTRRASGSSRPDTAPNTGTNQRASESADDLDRSIRDRGDEERGEVF